MKAPITLSKIGTYALTAALFVVFYTMLGHLIETLHSPKTIKQFLVLFVLHLSLSIVFHIYITRRKKSPESLEVEYQNGGAQQVRFADVVSERTIPENSDRTSHKDLTS